MWIIRESIYQFFRIIDFLILARIILSWINLNPYSTLPRIIYQITEPILLPFRNLLSKLGMGGTIDFSPFLAVIALNILKSIILGFF